MITPLIDIKISYYAVNDENSYSVTSYIVTSSCVTRCTAVRCRSTHSCNGTRSLLAISYIHALSLSLSRRFSWIFSLTGVNLSPIRWARGAGNQLINNYVTMKSSFVMRAILLSLDYIDIL